LQLSDYWPVLRRRWLLVLGVVAVAIISSYLFARLQTEVYRATVFLTVTARNDYGSTLVIENKLRQFARQLQTEILAEKVNDKLQLDIAPERLRGKVRVAAINEDLLLQIEVDDIEANRARSIAWQWAQQFVQDHQDREATAEPRDRIEIAPLDRPQPAVLNWPKRNQIMAAAAILGLLAGTVLAFVLEYLDDTLKTPGDVDRYLGVPLLAAIPPADEVVGRLPGANGASASTRAPARSA
jgi:capsular polysaccharide biosynthesis protein